MPQQYVDVFVVKCVNEALKYGKGVLKNVFIEGVDSSICVSIQNYSD